LAKLNPSDLTVEAVPIDSVQPHPGNYRRHLSKVLVEESINTHGQYRPLIVQRSSGNILAGNGTWEVLRDAGYEEVSVTYLDVDDAQAARILVVDNRTSDTSSNDAEVLAALLTGLGTLEGTGYTEQAYTELANLVRGASDIETLASVHGEIASEEDLQDPSLWPVARVPLSPEMYPIWQSVYVDQGQDATNAMQWIMEQAGLFELADAE
jgi:ParB-like nuclease domain